MDPILLTIIIVIGFFILEMTKHLFTRTTLRLVLVFFVVMILLFTLISSLSTNELMDSDNEYVQTGASIVHNINKEPLISEIGDNIKESFSNLKEDIVNRLNDD
jgi:hypothetical protein